MNYYIFKSEVSPYWSHCDICAKKCFPYCYCTDCSYVTYESKHNKFYNIRANIIISRIPILKLLITENLLNNDIITYIIYLLKQMLVNETDKYFKIKQPNFNKKIENK